MNNKTKTIENTTNDLVCGKPQIVFSQGLYGFEDYTDFELVESEHKPFMWMQSKKEDSLAFLVVDPFLFFTDYEIDVDDKNLNELGITNPEDVYILAIITMSRTKPPSITANLLAPVIINKNNNKAKQVVLDDSQWRTKHDLLAGNSTEGSPPC